MSDDPVIPNIFDRLSAFMPNSSGHQQVQWSGLAGLTLREELEVSIRQGACYFVIFTKY